MFKSLFVLLLAALALSLSFEVKLLDSPVEIVDSNGLYNCPSGMLWKHKACQITIGKPTNDYKSKKVSLSGRFRTGVFFSTDYTERYLSLNVDSATTDDTISVYLFKRFNDMDVLPPLQNLKNSDVALTFSVSISRESEVEIPSNGMWEIIIETSNENIVVMDLFAYGSQLDGGMILASRNLQGAPPTPLIPGVDQQGAVALNQYTYYSLTLSDKFDVVRIFVSPIVGDPDVYVTLSTTAGDLPTKQNYQYSAYGTVDETILIRANDTAVNAFCNGAGCIITIGVYGASSGVSSTDFTILVTLDNSVVPLINGEILNDVVVQNDCNYYSLVGSTVNGTVLVAVTTLSGDADLFIGSSRKGQTQPVPGNPNSYCWSSYSAGREVIQIPPTDQSGCYCNGMNGCEYFIGVCGWAAGVSRYNIMGEDSLMDPIQLVDGQPFSSYVEEYETSQFVFTWAGDSSGYRMLSSILTPSVGDVIMYVSLNNETVPDEGHYDYMLVADSVQEYLYITSSDAQVQKSPCADATKNCQIRISIEGLDSDLNWYRISFASTRPTVLSEGVTVNSFAPLYSWTYFLFEAPFQDNSNDDIIITVTPLSGNPNIYATIPGITGYLPSNTSGTYLWRGLGDGIESVHIPYSDLNVEACGANCIFTIGILGWDEASSFNIMVRTASGRSIQLLPGQPIYDTVETGMYNYYTVPFNFSIGYIYLALTSTSGDADLFAALDNRTVSISDKQYASMEADGFDFIPITSIDHEFASTCALNYPNPCSVSIAVMGYTNTSYAIQASGVYLTLPDSVPVSGIVNATGYDTIYYRFIATSYSAIHWQLAPRTSDPDIYISTVSPYPSKTSYQWKSEGLSMDVVTVDPADPNFLNCTLPCTFYAAVNAWGTTSAFSVLASTAPSTTLIDGQIIQAEAPAAQMVYYTYTAPPNDNTGFSVTVTPLSGVPDMQVFVGNEVDSSSGRTYFPSISCEDLNCVDYVVDHARWYSGDASNINEAFVPPTDPYYVPGGFYTIGVYSEGGGLFTIVAAAGDSITTLYPRTPIESSTNGVVGTFFRIDNTLYNATIRVRLTPIVGDPDLYGSSSSLNRRPSPSEFNASSEGEFIEEIVFTWNDLPECQAVISPDSTPISGTTGICSVYIGVFGFNAPATFSIVGIISSSSTQTPIALLDGVPQSDYIPTYADTSLFVANVAFTSPVPYSFYLRPLIGDPDLYITTTTGQPPTLYPPSYDYFSTTLNQEIIDIYPGDERYRQNASVYALVRCATAPCEYILTYSSGLTVMELQESVPVIRTIPSHQYAYFYLTTFDPLFATEFDLTAQSGNANLFVSVWPPANPRFRPSNSNYTWKSNQVGDDEVTILPSDPQACLSDTCNYIVAIYCASVANCRFSLYGQHNKYVQIPLVTGVPQAGRAIAPALTYYSYIVSDTTLPITVQLTPLSGTAQVFINALYDASCRPACGSLPNRTSYQWTSSTNNGGAGPGFVTIAGSDPKLVPVPGGSGSVILTIGVLSASYSASYLITVTQGSWFPLLVPGVAQSFSIPPNSNKIVQMLSNDISSDLTFAASVLAGDVVLLVSSPGMDALSNPPGCAPGITNPTVPGQSCNGTWISRNSASVSETVRIFAPQSDTSAGPCVGPSVYNNAAGNFKCDPVRDWQAGYYSVAIYSGNQSAQVTLLGSSGDSYETLADGQPTSGVTVPGSPAIYAFFSTYSLNTPTVRIELSVDDLDVEFFLYSCDLDSCAPKDQVPSPEHYELAGYVPADTSQEIFLNKLSPAYCTPSDPNNLCAYFLAVYTSAANGPQCTQAGNANCSASFDLLASEQNGPVPDIIPFNSVKNNYYSSSANLVAGGTGVFQVYLPQGSTPNVQPTNMTITLEACGPGYPSIYVCNPDDYVACENPFLPGPGNGNNSMSGHTAAHGGSVTLFDSYTDANMYFFSVIADGAVSSKKSARNAFSSIFSHSKPFPPPKHAQIGSALHGFPTMTLNKKMHFGNSISEMPLGDGEWLYTYAITAGHAMSLETSPTLPSLEVIDGNGISVSWAPVVFSDVTTPNTPINAASQAEYYVYLGPGGFNSAASVNSNSGNDFITGTVCGLKQFASVTQVFPVGPTDRGINSLTVLGLEPDTFYQYSIVAECDNVCISDALADLYKIRDFVEESKNVRLRASPYAPMSGLLGLESVISADVADFIQVQLVKAGKKMTVEQFLHYINRYGELVEMEGGGLMLPNYVSQWVSYPVLNFTTGASSAVTKHAFPIAGTISIIVIALVLVSACVGYVIYKRRSAESMASQYHTLDTKYAMETISTPVESGWSFNFLSKKRSALADTEYSSIEDAVAGYL